jgi:hypothetical protein
VHPSLVLPSHVLNTALQEKVFTASGIFSLVKEVKNLKSWAV